MHAFSVRAYGLTFACLIALTATTVGISFLDLGAWHAPLGVFIASLKALTVALIFMHLLKSTKLTWLVALAASFWLGILILFTLSDYLTRTWLDK